MKHVELFSGIGGFRRAMDLITSDLLFPINTIAYSEIDEKANVTYKSNYFIDNEIEIGDIVEFTKDKSNVEQLPDFDIISAGFPCQPFSIMGKQKGFSDDRGYMFFRIMDIVNIKHPKYLILENVRNLISHDNGNTLKVILSELDLAGYNVKYDVFNSSDFGLPQTRRRIILFCRRKEYGDFEFSSDLVKQYFNPNDTSLNIYSSTLDILQKEVDKKYYISNKSLKYILADGTKNFKATSDIDQLIARPLTATMHKMHRANCDNYFSDNFIQSNGKDRPSEYLSKEELYNIPIRKITPQETFMLQGFPNYFHEKPMLNKVSNTALYKQAGNAVSVNVIYAVLNYLIKTNIISQ